jgi:hypothetical protein
VERECNASGTDDGKDERRNTKRERPYLVVPSNENRTIRSDRHWTHRDIRIRYQLVTHVVLRQIPDFDAPVLIAGDKLALVWVDDDVVDGGMVVVVALDGGSTVGALSREGGDKVGKRGKAIWVVSLEGRASGLGQVPKRRDGTIQVPRSVGRLGEREEEGIGSDGMRKHGGGDGLECVDGREEANKTGKGLE